MQADVHGPVLTHPASALNARRKNICSGPVGDLLALILGALTVFAFAPFNVYPLAVLTLAALFWLLGGVGVRRAFLRGLLF